MQELERSCPFPSFIQRVSLAADLSCYFAELARIPFSPMSLSQDATIHFRGIRKSQHMHSCFHRQVLYLSMSPSSPIPCIYVPYRVNVLAMVVRRGWQQVTVMTMMMMMIFFRPARRLMGFRAKVHNTDTYGSGHSPSAA